MSLAGLSCEAFAAALSSKAPVPGGGGAAALSGALGSALAGMVAALTSGKKKYATYETDLQRILEKTEALREDLLRMIDEDAENFLPLSEAYSLPKKTEEEKAYRERVISERSKKAAEAPEKIIRLCHEAVPLMAEAYEKGSVLAVSDAGCSAVLLKAAVQAAYLNVLVNRQTVRDGDGTDDALAALLRMTEEDMAVCDDVYEKVLLRLKK